MCPLSRTRSCGPLRGVGADLNGAAAVVGGDASGDAVAGVEVVGEGGGGRVEVHAGKQFEAQPVGVRPGERRRKPAAGVADHEVDGGGRDGLRGHHEIALVLAVLVVHQDDHPAGPEFVERSSIVQKPGFGSSWQRGQRGLE